MFSDNCLLPSQMLVYSWCLGNYHRLSELCLQQPSSIMLFEKAMNLSELLSYPVGIPLISPSTKIFNSISSSSFSSNFVSSTSSSDWWLSLCSCRSYLSKLLLVLTLSPITSLPYALLNYGWTGLCIILSFSMFHSPSASCLLSSLGFPVPHGSSRSSNAPHILCLSFSYLATH